MREVHHPHDAEDDREPQRHQPIDHARQQALGDGLREREEEVGGHSFFGARTSRSAFMRPGGPRSGQVRRLSFQPGIGKTSGAAAEATGITTVGLRLRFSTAAALMLTFWPLASNWIGPPMITCWSILVLRKASIRASGLVDLAVSQACAATSSPSKVKPALMSSWSLGNFAAWRFSSDWVIADFGSSHGTLEIRKSLYLPMVLKKSCS